MAFYDALTDLIRRTIKAYVKDVSFFYKAKVTSRPSGKVYSLDDGSLATILNNGEYAVGDEVLVIKTLGGKKFIYYWNPGVSVAQVTPERNYIMYYTPSTLRYCLLTPNNDHRDGSDIPIMSASMSTPVPLTDLTILRMPDQFQSYTAYTVPANFVSWEANEAVFSISGATVSSTFLSTKGVGYLGTGFASMGAFTDYSASCPFDVIPGNASYSAFLMLSPSGNYPVFFISGMVWPTKASQLTVWGSAGAMYSATSNPVGFPELALPLSFSCYSMVSGVQYAIGEYTSGTSGGALVFKNDGVGDPELLKFRRSGTGDSNFYVTPSGFLVSPSYIRHLTSLTSAPVSVSQVTTSTNTDTFVSKENYVDYAATDASASVFYTDLADQSMGRFCIVPKTTGSYTGFETSMEQSSQLKRYGVSGTRSCAYLAVFSPNSDVHGYLASLSSFIYASVTYYVLPLVPQYGPAWYYDIVEGTGVNVTAWSSLFLSACDNKYSFIPQYPPFMYSPSGILGVGAPSPVMGCYMMLTASLTSATVIALNDLVGGAAQKLFADQSVDVADQKSNNIQHWGVLGPDVPAQPSSRHDGGITGGVGRVCSTFADSPRRYGILLDDQITDTSSSPSSGLSFANYYWYLGLAYVISPSWTNYGTLNITSSATVFFTPQTYDHYDGNCVNPGEPNKRFKIGFVISSFYEYLPAITSHTPDGLFISLTYWE